MRIGLISDTHDDVRNLATALEILRAEQVTKLLHCGDVCGPDVIHALAGFDVWVAQGNMDRSLELAQATQGVKGNSRMAWIQRLVLDGYSIAMVHGDNEEALGNLISSGNYKYVFHGHTHRRRDQTIGRTRVINPGALGGARHQTRSFCILDSTTGEIRFVEIP